MEIPDILKSLRQGQGEGISPADIKKIYEVEFRGTGYSVQRMRFWEQSWYLEKVILKQPLNHEVAFSAIAILNLKQLEQINFWDNAELTAHLVRIFEYLTEVDQNTLSLEERTQQFQFMMQLFARPEISIISKSTLSYVSSALLIHTDKHFLKHHFLKYPKMVSSYIEVARVKGLKDRKEANFIHGLVQDLIRLLIAYPVDAPIEEEIPDKDDLQTHLRNLLFISKPKFVEDEREFQLSYRRVTKEQLVHLKYYEKFVDFMIQLLSAIPTRKFLKLYLLSQNVLPLLKVTIMQNHSSVLQTLVDLLDHYLTYPIDDLTGEQMTTETQLLIQKDFLKQLQTLIFKRFQFILQPLELEEFTFVKNLTTTEVKELFKTLSLVYPIEIPQRLYMPGLGFNNQLIEVLKEACPEPVVENPLLFTPLVPNEEMVWDYKRIPEESSLGVLKQALAIPKLNLQFLSFDDYLDRNYWLYKLESAYDLRKDLEDAIIRMAPVIDSKWRLTHFEGWARMALEIKKFKIQHVSQPLIGRREPKKVLAEVQYNVEKLSAQIKKEWDALKKHDVVFLVSFYSKELEEDLIERMVEFTIDNRKKTSDLQRKSKKIQDYGIRAIRGAEITVQYDERRKEIQEWEVKDLATKYQGFVRILNVEIDPVQYQEDLESGINSEGEIYGNFKLIIRRKPKENNFKAVLNSIKDVVHEKPKLPQFLSQILLGYGVQDESSSFRRMQADPASSHFNFFDTFVDEQHYKEAFLQNPNIPQQLKDNHKFKPKLPDAKVNSVRFTQPQVNALTSSMYEGVNLVVGPPGTGKTDLAVQIVNLLYHNFRNEKTLVITHSNHALNDIFEKITTLDIDEKHLLRLGIGEKELKLQKEYSKSGRINHMLALRLQYLELIGTLQVSLEIRFTEAFTCEIADIFYKTQIVPLQRKFESDPESGFPFTRFVEQNEALFVKARTHDEQWRVIEGIFEVVNETRAFEILRNKRERGNYIVGMQAKIIAMTCTHAALKRKSFLDQDFTFENVLIEEAGQILEIEAFLPLTMTKRNLKRVILIGDHNQLPPVIKNVSFQKIANMEQSLFIRLIRLGVHPHVLEHQGRARLELIPLFLWKYPQLKSLEHCYPQSSNEFGKANAGFQKLFQFIDVDYAGQGETRPAPYIYQNLQEAEFVVAVYMYMVLIGYDPSKITILTTYNGQKLLIRDIIQRKCAWHSLFRRPSKVRHHFKRQITTVDKFQGQQNDFILLTMVRTEYVGYLRDIRRIIVALSRARLGLYVFGKYDLFAQIPESKQSFNQFTKEGLKLVLNERVPTPRSYNASAPAVDLKTPDEVYSIVKGLLEQAQKHQQE